MKKANPLGLAMTFVLASLSLFSQIRGRVVEISVSSDTTLLPGVILRWDGSDVHAVSDGAGNFAIPVVQHSQKLLVQSIGFEEKSIVVRDTISFMLVVLKGAKALEEIDVVYYSTGTEISYLNAIKTETLTERSLMKAACCNLSESFETNPSIDVNFSDAVSGTKQIQMLGLGGQYAQITKENMPYMRGLAGNYGLTFIPGTWIQSIQLSKGAGSVVNGYESFTGQINTELQNPEQSDKLHFNVYGNQNGRNEYNLNLSGKVSKKLKAGLLTHFSNNPLVEDMNMDGFADIPLGRQINVMNKYSYQNPDKGFEAQFGGGYLEDQRNGGQFWRILDHKHDTFPLYKINLDNKKWELYSKTGFVFKKKPGHSAGLQLSYLDHQQKNTYGYTSYSGLQKTFYANLIYQGILNNTNNSYKFGMSFLNDEVSETFNRQVYRRHESVPGIFAEFAKNYREKFNLVAGLRGDYHNYYGFFYTPRLHLRYAFTPGSVLRFSGGGALRTANVFTDNAYLMASSRSWQIRTEDSRLPYGLQPEKGWNYGMNFTQKFKINYREAYVTLDVYRTEFSQQVVVDVDKDVNEVNIYNLKGPSYSNTMQFEFNMEPKKRLFLKTAYRFVDTRVSYEQGLLMKALVSPHRGFINFSYETRNQHWQFDFTTQYNGWKRLPSTQGSPDQFRRDERSPNYYNVLSQITYMTKFKGAIFNVYLGVENLLNYRQSNPIVAANEPFSQHFDASMVWGPIYGRMLYAGLRYRIKE